jgi:hypothetical protein
MPNPRARLRRPVRARPAEASQPRVERVESAACLCACPWTRLVCGAPRKAGGDNRNGGRAAIAAGIILHHLVHHFQFSGEREQHHFQSRTNANCPKGNLIVYISNDLPASAIARPSTVLRRRSITALFAGRGVAFGKIYSASLPGREQASGTPRLPRCHQL